MYCSCLDAKTGTDLQASINMKLQNQSGKYIQCFHGSTNGRKKNDAANRKTEIKIFFNAADARIEIHSTWQKE